MNKSWMWNFLIELFWKIPVLLIIYFLLAIPDPPGYQVIVDENELSRLINENVHDVWDRVNDQLNNPRYEGTCSSDSSEFYQIKSESEQLTEELSQRIKEAGSPDLLLLENYLYEMGAYAFNCPDLVDDYIESASRSIEAVKNQAGYWDYSSFSTKERLHNILTGSRAIMDEILKRNSFESDRWISVYHSAERSLDSMINDGDILAVRRGDFLSNVNCSANLYPGHYSNLMAVYDDQGKKVIELDYIKGPIIKPYSEIEEQAPSRIMLCRTKQGEAALLGDLSLLQDRTDEGREPIFQTISNNAIPFDYSRNINESDMLFDYELVVLLTRQNNELLSGGISSFQNDRLKRWLSQIGMEHFEPYSSTDIVYDPTMILVGEWVNPSMILQDHINSVALEKVMAVTMEQDEIYYSRWNLPLERLRKGFSNIMGLLGYEITKPVGLNATESLKIKTLRRDYNSIRNFLTQKAKYHLSVNNELPNYSELRAFAESVE